VEIGVVNPVFYIKKILWYEYMSLVDYLKL
jgi:hypothetical protein